MSLEEFRSKLKERVDELRRRIEERRPRILEKWKGVGTSPQLYGQKSIIEMVQERIGTAAAKVEEVRPRIIPAVKEYKVGSILTKRTIPSFPKLTTRPIFPTPSAQIFRPAVVSPAGLAHVEGEAEKVKAYRAMSVEV
jgi:hypothetical protein